MARSANEQLYDASVLRKIRLLDLEQGEADRVSALLVAVERDILDQIGLRLASGRSVDRLEALLRSVHDLVEAGVANASDLIEASMAEVAIQEAAFETSSIERVSPVTLELATVPLEVLKALSQDPVQGLSVSRWFKGISDSAVQRIERELRIGIAQGDTLDSLMARVRGTRANAYQDGVMNATKRDAEAIARTALSSASTAARDLVWQANADVVLCLRWTSVLDGRTTLICQSRDGQVAPVTEGQSVPDDVDAPRLDPPGARPPAHISCRSIMVAVLDPTGVVGERPYVGDDRVRSAREADFRAEARDRGVPLRQVRSEWADRVVGRLPSSTTYAEFFARQPEAFQRAVLGPSRFKLYRQGRPLGAFVDPNTGRRLTLDELAGR